MVKSIVFSTEFYEFWEYGIKKASQLRLAVWEYNGDGMGIEWNGDGNGLKGIR